VTIAAPSLPEPIVLAESAAICEYLCDHFAPHLVPTRWREGCEGKVGGETEQWLRYRFYMHYAEGSLMSLLMIAMFMGSKYFLPLLFNPLKTWSGDNFLNIVHTNRKNQTSATPPSPSSSSP
jgi:glutathione S-transferase